MEYDDEPIRGLPGLLPKGEDILWQGKPDWWLLARTSFHLPLVSAYFGALIVAGLIAGSTFGALLTLGAGVFCLALLAFLAWATANGTVYTLTNRRIVLRIGIALPKCINLPLHLLGAADLRPHGTGRGDVLLRMMGAVPLSWLLLWPHVRPWRLKAPEPMLRALRDAEDFSRLLARTVAQHAPISAPEQPSVRPAVTLPEGAMA